METVVTAEFDSVELADLASGRVRGLDGVTGVEVRGGAHGAHDAHGAPGETDVAFAVAPASGMFSTTGMPYTAPAVPAVWDVRETQDTESGRRREAFLKVTVLSDEAARSVSALLRNLGGRRVHLASR